MVDICRFDYSKKRTKPNKLKVTGEAIVRELLEGYCLPRDEVYLYREGFIVERWGLTYTAYRYVIWLNRRANREGGVHSKQASGSETCIF